MLRLVIDRPRLARHALLPRSLCSLPPPPKTLAKAASVRARLEEAEVAAKLEDLAHTAAFAELDT